VIVVTEGAGQDLLEKNAECDPSGNVKYGDVGAFLRDAIKDYSKKISTEVSIKYIIRSVPANAHDSAFCLLLAHNAVHAGLSGRTNMVVGFWNHQFTHVPILAAPPRKKIDPEGTLWNSVLASIGQPCKMY
jgi:6-phosphofructokinase 1